MAHESNASTDAGATAAGTNAELSAALRPAFFPGQLLSAADLDAMLQWAGTHLQLLRRSHGAGVAAGLEVSAASPDAVRIEAGYALDPGGRTIVSPRAHVHSLAKLAHVSKVDFGDGTAEWDLVALYRETGSEPRRVLNTRGFDEVASENFGRIVEGVEFGLRKAARGEHRPEADGVRDREWIASLDAVRSLQDGWLFASTAAVQARLLRALDNRPLLYAPAVERRVRAREDLDTPAERLRTALWIVLDRRIAAALTSDAAAHSGDGVPLARLRIRGGEEPELLFVDVVSPVRRTCGTSLSGSGDGQVDLTRVVGQTPRQAERQLAGLGLQVRRLVTLEPERRSPDEIVRLLDHAPYANSGDAVVLIAAPASHHSDRVIGALVSGRVEERRPSMTALLEESEALARAERLEAEEEALELQEIEARETDAAGPDAIIAERAERALDEIREDLDEEAEIAVEQAEVESDLGERGDESSLAALAEEAEVEIALVASEQRGLSELLEDPRLSIEQELGSWERRSHEANLIITVVNAGEIALTVEFHAPQFDEPLAPTPLAPKERRVYRRPLPVPGGLEPTAISTVEAHGFADDGRRVDAGSTFMLAVRKAARKRAWWRLGGPTS